jgi:hypothetical protein
MAIVLPALESHVTAATSRSPDVVVTAFAESEETRPSDEPLVAWRKETAAGAGRGKNDTQANKPRHTNSGQRARPHRVLLVFMTRF